LYSVERRVRVLTLVTEKSCFWLAAMSLSCENTGQADHIHTRASVPKQYNLVPAKGQCRWVAGILTAGGPVGK